MKKIIIKMPSYEDIHLIRKWGTNARELWAYEGSGWHSEETLKDYIDNPKDDFFRIAKFEEQIAGMILVNVLRNWAYVDFLFVDSKYRRKGVGKSLIATALKHVHAKGIDAIHLVTHPDNQSVQFYNNLDFKKGDTLIWMRKEVSEPI